MTTPVCLIFFCTRAKLQFVHDFPSHLLISDATPSFKADVDGESHMLDSDEEDMSKSLTPLMAEHEGAFRDALPSNCRICKREVKIHPLFTPVSIDYPEDNSTQLPTINIWVDRHCARSQCRSQAQDEATSMLALYNTQVQMKHEEAVRWGEWEENRQTVQERECDECGRRGGELEYCDATCEAAVCCGKRCQMTNWPKHKVICMVGK